MVGRLHEARLTAADRAGLVVAGEGLLGISEILGGLVDQLANLVGPELDVVRLGHEPARHVHNVDAHRLGRVGSIAATANRRRIGIELEGIEGRKFARIGRQLGGEARDDAQIRLDGDELAAALPLDHRIVDDVAGGEARGGHLDAVNVLLWSFNGSYEVSTYARLVDKTGKTARQLAEEKMHKDVVQKLMQY